MFAYDGFYGIAQIKSIDPDTKIITITADQSEEMQSKQRNVKDLIIFKLFDADFPFKCSINGYF